MKKLIITISILAAVIVLAISNPSSEAHKSKVKEVFHNKVSIEKTLTASDNSFEQAGAAMGSVLGLALVDKIIDAKISSDSYVLFSLTKLTHEDKSRVIGYGVLGNVFISDDFASHITTENNSELDEAQ